MVTIFTSSLSFPFSSLPSPLSFPFPAQPTQDLLSFTARCPLSILDLFFCCCFSVLGQTCSWLSYSSCCLLWSYFSPPFSPFPRSAQRPDPVLSTLLVSLQKERIVDSSPLWVNLGHFDLKLMCGISPGSLRGLITELKLNPKDQMENTPPILCCPSLVPHV